MTNTSLEKDGNGCPRKLFGAAIGVFSSSLGYVISSQSVQLYRTSLSSASWLNGHFKKQNWPRAKSDAAGR